MAEAPERLERSTVVALGAMAIAVFVIANDVTALSVVLPDIEQDLDADVGTVQWVISAYALIIGAAGFGNAAGPLLGGFLTDALDWRWIRGRLLPDRRDGRRGRRVAAPQRGSGGG
jgi:MFS family permease